MTDVQGEFDWLDVQPGQHTGLEQRAPRMRLGEHKDTDRVWYSDGHYVWFRRAEANPATLERHKRFLAAGDYKHIETQDGVEIYELQDSSQFKKKPQQIDIAGLNTYNVRRQAVLAACRRDWKAFRDIMSYLRERIVSYYFDPEHPGANNFAETMYAEQYMAVMASIDMRHGPSPQEINKELHALAGGKPNKQKLITIGGEE